MQLECSEAYVKKLRLCDFAAAYIQHDALRDKPTLLNRKQRQPAYDALANTLHITPALVLKWEKTLRRYVFGKVIELRSTSASRLPRWLLEAIRAMRLSDEMNTKVLGSGLGRAGGAVCALTAAARRRASLCARATYRDARAACSTSRTSVPEMHAVWVRTQRVCMRSVWGAARLGDLPPEGDPSSPGGRPPLGTPSPPAARVADLVLFHTDVKAQRLLTPESASSYTESPALLLVWELVQRHVLHQLSGDIQRLPHCWTRVWKDYKQSGRVASIVVLQRRWHELKLQARHVLLSHWRRTHTHRHIATQTHYTHANTTQHNLHIAQTVNVTLTQKTRANVFNVATQTNLPTRDLHVGSTLIFEDVSDTHSVSNEDTVLIQPAPIHLDILRKCPWVATRRWMSWERLCTDDLVVQDALTVDSDSDAVDSPEDPARARWNTDLFALIENDDDTLKDKHDTSNVTIVDSSTSDDSDIEPALEIVEPDTLVIDIDDDDTHTQQKKDENITEQIANVDKDIHSNIKNDNNQNDAIIKSNEIYIPKIITKDCPEMITILENYLRKSKIAPEIKENIQNTSNTSNFNEKIHMNMKSETYENLTDNKNTEITEVASEVIDLKKEHPNDILNVLNVLDPCTIQATIKFDSDSEDEQPYLEDNKDRITMIKQEYNVRDRLKFDDDDVIDDVKNRLKFVDDDIDEEKSESEEIDPKLLLDAKVELERIEPATFWQIFNKTGPIKLNIQNVHNSADIHNTDKIIHKIVQDKEIEDSVAPNSNKHVGGIIESTINDQEILEKNENIDIVNSPIRYKDCGGKLIAAVILEDEDENSIDGEKVIQDIKGKKANQDLDGERDIQDMDDEIVIQDINDRILLNTQTLLERTAIFISSDEDEDFSKNRQEKRSRVAKKVELPDIEEVRRVNRNILTAQVAPITAQVVANSAQVTPNSEHVDNNSVQATINNTQVTENSAQVTNNSAQAISTEQIVSDSLQVTDTSAQASNNIEQVINDSAQGANFNAQATSTAQIVFDTSQVTDTSPLITNRSAQVTNNTMEATTSESNSAQATDTNAQVMNKSAQEEANTAQDIPSSAQVSPITTQNTNNTEQITSNIAQVESNNPEQVTSDIAQVESNNKESANNSAQDIPDTAQKSPLECSELGRLLCRVDPAESADPADSAECEELPSELEVRQLVDKLAVNMFANVCCEVRGARYSEDTKLLGGDAPNIIHTHAQSECSCCCRWLSIVMTSPDLRDELRSLREHILRVVKFGKKPDTDSKSKSKSKKKKPIRSRSASVSEQTELSDVDSCQRTKETRNNKRNDKKNETQESESTQANRNTIKRPNTDKGNDNSKKSNKKLKTDVRNKETNTKEGKAEKNKDNKHKKTINTSVNSEKDINTSKTLVASSTNTNHAKSYNDGYLEWMRQKNINSFYFKPKPNIVATARKALPKAKTYKWHAYEEAQPRAGISDIAPKKALLKKAIQLPKHIVKPASNKALKKAKTNASLKKPIEIKPVSVLTKEKRSLLITDVDDSANTFTPNESTSTENSLNSSQLKTNDPVPPLLNISMPVLSHVNTNMPVPSISNNDVPVSSLMNTGIVSSNVNTSMPHWDHVYSKAPDSYLNTNMPVMPNTHNPGPSFLNLSMPITSQVTTSMPVSPHMNTGMPISPHMNTDIPVSSQMNTEYLNQPLFNTGLPFMPLICNMPVNLSQSFNSINPSMYANVPIFFSSSSQSTNTPTLVITPSNLNSESNSTSISTISQMRLIITDKLTTVRNESCLNSINSNLATITRNVDIPVNILPKSVNIEQPTEKQTNKDKPSTSEENLRKIRNEEVVSSWSNPKLLKCVVVKKQSGSVASKTIAKPPTYTNKTKANLKKPIAIISKETKKVTPLFRSVVNRRTVVSFPPDTCRVEQNVNRIEFDDDCIELSDDDDHVVEINDDSSD